MDNPHTAPFALILVCMAHLQLDPNLPLCWEDSETLRVGFEDARARLHDPSPGAQRLLYALLRGIDPDRVAESARAVGISPREAERIISTLGPALTTRDAPPTPGPARRRAATANPGLSIAVCDAGREVPGLIAAIAGTGLCRLDPEHQLQPPELIVYVERFMEPLERAQRWLMAGVPQLLMRFTDTAVHVGPVVAPPGAPCHACVALALMARDPAYPVLAAQLTTVTPRSETAAAAGVAAGFAGALIRDWLDGVAHARGARIVIPTAHGRVAAPPRFETVEPHPECACALE